MKRAKTVFSVSEFIDEPDKFLNYLMRKIKIIGVSKFDVDRFELLYPEKFLGFLYVDMIKKFQLEYINKKKKIEPIKELEKESKGSY